MSRPLISLYVLLTTPLPVPHTLLARAAAVVLAFVTAGAVEPWTGVNPLNLAVAAGLTVTAWRNLPRVWFEGEVRDAPTGASMLAIILCMIATALVLPPATLQITVSLGVLAMAAIYAVILWGDPDMLDRLGWKAEIWGIEGRANAARWQILRCVGLGTAYAYAAMRLPDPEWIVAHAALPLVFYALFHWTVIATHPYEDDA